MEINKALEPLGIPVCHPPYSGAARTFLTYQYMGQAGNFYAESREAETGASFALDLFTDGEYMQLIRDIKALAEAANYTCVVDQEMYEQDTGLRHIAMTVTAAEEIYG